MSTRFKQAIDPYGTWFERDGEGRRFVVSGPAGIIECAEPEEVKVNWKHTGTAAVGGGDFTRTVYEVWSANRLVVVETCLSAEEAREFVSHCVSDVVIVEVTRKVIGGRK